MWYLQFHFECDKLLMSLRPMLSSSLVWLQLADRNSILTVGGFLVKRIAFTEPRVKRGVFLLQKHPCVHSYAAGISPVRTCTVRLIQTYLLWIQEKLTINLCWKDFSRVQFYYSFNLKKASQFWYSFFERTCDFGLWMGMYGLSASRRSHASI